MTSNAKKLERIVEAVRSPHDQRFGLSHDLKAARRLATAYEKATARADAAEVELARIEQALFSRDLAKAIWLTETRDFGGYSTRDAAAAADAVYAHVFGDTKKGGSHE